MSRWTKRPKNYCRACGDSWYPRGRNTSPKCPRCGTVWHIENEDDIREREAAARLALAKELARKAAELARIRREEWRKWWANFWAWFRGPRLVYVAVALGSLGLVSVVLTALAISAVRSAALAKATKPTAPSADPIRVSSPAVKPTAAQPPKPAVIKPLQRQAEPPPDLEPEPPPVRQPDPEPDWRTDAEGWGKQYTYPDGFTKWATRKDGRPGAFPVAVSKPAPPPTITLRPVPGRSIPLALDVGRLHQWERAWAGKDEPAKRELLDTKGVVLIDRPQDVILIWRDRSEDWAIVEVSDGTHGGKVLIVSAFDLPAEKR